MIRYGGFYGGDDGSRENEEDSLLSGDMDSPGQEQEVVYSVSEITEEIKGFLARSFSHICVRGEVSGAKTTSKGHTYFDLKDGKSVINCVLFKWSAPKFKQNVKDGMQVRVWGSITVYGSRYQINVNDMMEEGIGPLQIAFEKLKQKLNAEGLFDPSRKRPLPPFPKQIGVVTSPTGAAIKDILSVLRRRGGNLRIILSPALVQGKGSAEDIAAAIKLLNDNFPETDVMLVGRGGGSLEDLWSFNEEIVARAIAASKIPVISCVGHEIDTTIADFVADKRAETPSAAAEMVVKSRKEIIQKVDNLKRRLLQGLRIYYENLSGRFQKLASSRIFLNPILLLEKPARELDETTERMIQSQDRLIRERENTLRLLSGKLQALSPMFPLKKGYALVRDMSGNAVKDAARLSPGDRLSLMFSKGEAIAEVLNNNGSQSVGGADQKPVLNNATNADGNKNQKISKRNRKKQPDNPDQEMLW